MSLPCRAGRGKQQQQQQQATQTCYTSNLFCLSAVLLRGWSQGKLWATLLAGNKHASHAWRNSSWHLYLYLYLYSQLWGAA